MSWVAAHQSAWLRGTTSHRLKYPAVWKRSWKVKKPSLQLQNTCILASIRFPKQSERECFDFETLFRNLEPPWAWDSRHSLTHLRCCCWILGKRSSNFAKFYSSAPQNILSWFRIGEWRETTEFLNQRSVGILGTQPHCKRTLPFMYNFRKVIY